MSQSFEEFCRNSTIWDLDLLVNSSYPQFTECFQNTLLVWVPCGLVWVLLPFYMYSMFRSTEPPLPWSCLNVSKSILAVVLFLLTSVDLLFVYFGENADDTRYSTAFYLAGGIKAATFLLAALIVQMERRNGVRSSAVLFTFWFLSTLASIVPFYTLIVEKVYKDDLFHFTMFYISFTFIPVQLVLSSFAEKYHYNGYQTLGKPQCPQVYASFPSVLTFWWMTSLIVNTFRSGIDEDQFWELHPRDQGANFLPRFHKAWQEELGRYRKSE